MKSRLPKVADYQISQSRDRGSWLTHRRSREDPGPAPDLSKVREAQWLLGVRKAFLGFL